jgi:integrase
MGFVDCWRPSARLPTGACFPGASRCGINTLGDVERGLDPAEQRLEERHAITVGDLSLEYLAKAEAGLIIGRKGLPKRASTLEIDRGRIARHIVPLLGKKPIKDLTPADVKRFLEAVVSGKTATTIKTKARGLVRVTGGATAAVRAVGLLGGMLTYAREMGYIERNPAHGVRKPADKRRSFRLGPEEYRALGQALETAERRGEHWQATAAIRLVALTGCRRSEILYLKWSEVVSANCLHAAWGHENGRLHPTTAKSCSGYLGRHSAPRRLRLSGPHTRPKSRIRVEASPRRTCGARMLPAISGRLTAFHAWLRPLRSMPASVTDRGFARPASSRSTRATISMPGRASALGG